MESVIKDLKSIINKFLLKLRLKKEKKEDKNIEIFLDTYLSSSDLYNTFLFAKNKYNYSFYNTNVYKTISQNLNNIIEDNQKLNNIVNIDNVLAPIYNLFGLSILKNFNYLISLAAYITFLMYNNLNENTFISTKTIEKIKNIMNQNKDNLLSEYEKSSSLPVFKEANIFILSNIKKLLSSLNPVNNDISNSNKVFEMYFKFQILNFILSNINSLDSDTYSYIDSLINECFNLFEPLKNDFKDFYYNNKQILGLNFYRAFIDMLSRCFTVSYKTNPNEAAKLVKSCYELNLAKTDPYYFESAIINPDHLNTIIKILNSINFDKKELKKNLASNFNTIYINSISSYLKDSIKNGQSTNGSSLDYLYIFFLTTLALDYLNKNGIDTKLNYMLSNLRNSLINKPIFSEIYNITFTNNKDQLTSLLDVLNKISLRTFLSTLKDMPSQKEFYLKLYLLTKISTKLNPKDPNYQKYINYLKQKFIDIFKSFPEANYLFQKAISNIVNNSIYPFDIFLNTISTLLDKMISNFNTSYSLSFLLNQVILISFLQNLENVKNTNFNNLESIKSKYFELVFSNVVSDQNINSIIQDYKEYLQNLPKEIVNDSFSDILFNYYTSSLSYVKIVN